MEPLETAQENVQRWAFFMLVRTLVTISDLIIPKFPWILQTCQRRQYRASPRRMLRHKEGLSRGVRQLRRPLLLRELHGGRLQRLAQDALLSLEGAGPHAPAREPGERFDIIQRPLCNLRHKNVEVQRLH